MIEARVDWKKSKAAGFSIIEVFVAMVILAIMLVTLIGVFIYGYNDLLRTKQIALATEICQDEVEIIRNMAYDSIVVLGSTFANDKLAKLTNGQGTQAVQSDAGSDIKKLTVSVSWNFRGQPMRKDIVTMVTRLGVDKK
jgi:Tfp pilus assembly protein PilV